MKRLLEVILIQQFSFLSQNARIMGVWTLLTERLRTLLSTITVIAESALDGSVSRGPLVQECQRHVHRITDVALMQPPG